MLEADLMTTSMLKYSVVKPIILSNGKSSLTIWKRRERGMEGGRSPDLHRVDTVFSVICLQTILNTV